MPRTMSWLLSGWGILWAGLVGGSAAQQPTFRFEEVPLEPKSAVLADSHFPGRDAQAFRSVLEIPGQYVNDHCLIHAAGQWHLFFIQGHVSKPEEKWFRSGNEAQIGHAVSVDLLHWKVLRPALTVGPAGSLESAHVFAPFVIEHGKKFHMFYAGNTVGLGSSRIFLATSDDLEHWQRHGEGPVIVSNPAWAAYRAEGYLGGRGGPVGCRDPHVIRHPQHGYILYFAEWMKGDSGRGTVDLEWACIAAATSHDLVHWVDRGPVLLRKQSCYEAGSYNAPESPCVLFRDGKYYLFWKGGNGTRYTISDNPLDFRDREAYFLGTCHAAEIFAWDGTWFATSCSRLVDDVAHRRSDRSRGLFLAGIEWDGSWPRLRRIAAP